MCAKWCTVQHIGLEVLAVTREVIIQFHSLSIRFCTVIGGYLRLLI